MLVAALPVQTCKAVMVSLRLLRLMKSLNAADGRAACLLSAYASACQSRLGQHGTIMHGWLRGKQGLYLIICPVRTVFNFGSASPCLCCIEIQSPALP